MGRTRDGVTGGVQLGRAAQHAAQLVRVRCLGRDQRAARERGVDHLERLRARRNAVNGASAVHGLC